MTVDAIERLNEMAHHQTAETDALKAIQKARVSLVLGKDAPAAFFATLALRLKPMPDWGIETAATDGRGLKYNPDWFLSLSPAERIGVIAHEVMHNAMCHPARRGNREPRKANVAMDLAINPIVRDAKMSLPNGALYPAEGQFADLPEGLSFEDYYSRLPDQTEGGNGNDPGGCGGVEDAGDQAAQQEMDADWQVAVSQAAQAAKSRGPLPGALGRLVEQVANPDVPWEDELREFVSRVLSARDDYSWSVPNRRYIASGLYLPSLRSECLGDIVVAVDTSMSIGRAELEAFAGELNGILECRPCKVTVVYCDAQVQKTVDWEPADGPLTLEAVGGGGTDHAPIWDWLRETGEQPECVVALTDGYTKWGEDPGVPVLWTISKDGTSEEAPFGRTVRMK